MHLCCCFISSVISLFWLCLETQATRLLTNKSALPVLVRPWLRKRNVKTVQHHLSIHMLGRIPTHWKFSASKAPQKVVHVILSTFWLHTKQRGTQTKWGKALIPKKAQNAQNRPQPSAQASNRKTEPWHQNTSSFLPCTPNTVNVGDPANSELSLHASLISWHKRSIDKSPARRPNPPGKERSLHLTNSVQRLQWRGYRRCAHSVPKTKHPHFRPTRCCSHKASYLHISF